MQQHEVLLSLANKHLSFRNKQNTKTVIERQVSEDKLEDEICLISYWTDVLCHIRCSDPGGNRAHKHQLLTLVSYCFIARSIPDITSLTGAHMGKKKKMKRWVFFSIPGSDPGVRRMARVFWERFGYQRVVGGIPGSPPQ